MNRIEQLKKEFITTLQSLFPNEALNALSFTLNTDSNKQQFGDISTNAAMILAKPLRRNPREVAAQIKDTFTQPMVDHIEMAGPGFLNLFLKPEVFPELLEEIITNQDRFFMDRPEKPTNYSIEFVSANPTGPLHLGHGRGGIIGDVLGNILSFLGHNVTKEFYINDAGSQMQKLGNSLKIRYLQQLGETIELPEDAYQGGYLVTLAEACVSKHGEALKDKDNAFFTDYAYKHMLKQLKETLSDYGIEYDVWFSERTLHDRGSVVKALEKLTHDGHTYEEDGALWFKSTEFGDDKDRVLRRANGDVTYIAADIAYMEDKFNRGSDHLIMILGQDHHSYVNRLTGLLQATGYGDKPLDVILYQLVSLKEDGESIRMSKRTGRMVTLREIIDLVGPDVARFFYLNRKADAQLDFDIALALKKTDENPVFYIQYAYVRLNSILTKAQEHSELRDVSVADAAGITTAEQLLIKKIVSLKALLLNIKKNHQTHLLTYYALELAQMFHSYYNKNKVIDLENIPQSRARLLIVIQLKQTIELVLRLLEVSAPERM